MAIHPIEYRYGRHEMKKIWDENSKLKGFITVEIALMKAHAEVGNIPKDSIKKVEEAAKKVKLERVKEIDSKINHDLMAVVKALAEKSGDAGKYIHLGATSYDIIDTAYALQFRKVLEILEKDLREFKAVLLRQASRTKDLVCIGRTHGQHAVPTTYGLRFALWACEIQRHLDRLNELRPRLLVGKMSGAVGTGAAFGDKAEKIEELTLKHLDIEPALVTTQIIQRDRHAEFCYFMSLVAETLNKIAVNLRSLQRTEIGEVYEQFDTKQQIGSSTMPQKTNPIHLERVCGLSRIITSNAFAQMRNIGLWDERDLTNSSSERIIFPESTILLDYILDMATRTVRNLNFSHANIEKNILLSKGLIMAERIMIELTSAGMGRQEAHETIRRLALDTQSKKIRFTDALKQSKKVTKYLSSDEIDKLMEPRTYVGNAGKKVERVLKELK